MDVVNFNEAEIPRPEDVTAISENAREAFDAVAEGVHGWPAHWSRLSIVQKAGSADIVQIAPGEFHSLAEIYASKDLIEQNLISFKPTVATEERWVALRLVGSSVSNSAVRAVETSATPLTESIPVNQSLPKYEQRRFTIDVVAGAITVPPATYPDVPDNVCVIAHVLLTSNGIQDIVTNEAARVKTIHEINGRVEELELQLEVLTLTTQSIITDLASIAQTVQNAPSRQLMSQVANDVGQLRRRFQFPEAARNYYFDEGLLDDFWDFTHPDAQFRIDQGIRHQFANQRETQMVLANPGDPAVAVYDNTIVFPAYSEGVRIESPKGSGRKDISNIVHTIRTAVHRQQSHTRIDWGPTVNVCENMAGWENIRSGAMAPQQLYAKDGQLFRSQPIAHPEAPHLDVPGHRWAAVNQMIRTSWTSTYTTYNVQEFGLSGAVYGQTFTNGQSMIMTSIDLYFMRVGSTGDIQLCVCELTPSGAPDFEAVIARTNKPQSELSNGWTNIQIPPTELAPGKRYAFFTVTSGNHQLAANNGNAFPGGTLFLCTDGVWAQGFTKEDLSFRINGARFEQSRTVVELGPVGLDGGLTQMTFIYKSITPPGTSIEFEVLPVGQNEWVPLDGRDPSPIGNLPPQCQVRAVFQGAADVCPGMVLDTEARITTGRMHLAGRAVSKLLNFGFATDTVEVIFNVDNYDTLRHTAVPRLLINDAPVDPSSLVQVVDPTKDSRTEVRAVFDFGVSPISSCRLRLDTSGDSATFLPFGQDVQLNAF
ncbi:hypothetical protein J7444_08170 [Labrenzia sp. R4_1]|uniref:hypothetical protein n=1 Tax=Labrenzia sp. R4_1 TaxID=2821106 RepID=UPI001ADBB9D0|nr:hypothetical protein [Labrenzia sp. R4_1]MBO9424693.1 hypothetical protein [Labrenzia sp. R4_1]